MAYIAQFRVMVSKDLNKNIICNMDDVREDFLGPPHGTTPAAAYKRLMRPVLEYGSSVWEPHTHGLHEELEKGPKSCGKVCDWKLCFCNSEHDWHFRSTEMGIS